MNTSFQLNLYFQQGGEPTCKHLFSPYSHRNTAPVLPAIQSLPNNAVCRVASRDPDLSGLEFLITFYLFLKSQRWFSSPYLPLAMTLLQDTPPQGMTDPSGRE